MVQSSRFVTTEW